MERILRVLAVVLLLLIPSGGPAAAAGETAVEAHVGDLTLAVDGPEKLTLLWLRATGTTGTEHHFTLTVDHSDVSDFAEVDMALVTAADIVIGSSSVASSPALSSDPCTRTDTGFSCEWDEVLYRSGSLASIALVTAKPTDTATKGDEGKLVVTAAIDGEASTSEAAVRVGEPVDVAAGADQEITAAPGGTAVATPTVRNTGTTPVNGVVMYLSVDERLRGASSYSNCHYADVHVVCTFDTTLAAESSYALADAIRLRPPADSVPGSRAQAVVQWMTATEWADMADALPDGFLGEAGDGEALELTEAGSGLADPQSDTEPENDSGTIELVVGGSAEPDFAAVGAKVTNAGSGARIRVGARNVGPGTLHPDLYPNNQIAALIRLPGNVEPAGIDRRCGNTGVAFVCRATLTMAPGDGDTFTFEVSVVEKSGAAGRVTVSDTLSAAAESVDEPVAGAAADVRAADARNNTATIVVTGSGGAGGGLPVTGSDAAGTAAAGVALVALGLVLALRRPVYPDGARETVRGRHRKDTSR